MLVLQDKYRTTVRYHPEDSSTAQCHTDTTDTNAGLLLRNIRVPSACILVCIIKAKLTYLKVSPCALCHYISTSVSQYIIVPETKDRKQLREMIRCLMHKGEVAYVLNASNTSFGSYLASEINIILLTRMFSISQSHQRRR